MELTRDQRLYLRAQAHGLDPVVMIGNNGLTDAVIREIAVNLDAHELIKVRVLGDDRAQREAWYAEICEALGCAAVQHIGKLLVLYRPITDGKSRLELPGEGRKTPAKPADKTAKPAAKVDTGRAGGGKQNAKAKAKAKAPRS
ncbi:YhbY family RNA-binding protein [Chitinimonas koreensis]|uniref:YhbY family RNA-binding protein n=1 Tax=Chitinimonas koreensis TaxID=356302 RepID=UPI0003FB64DD|nr:YhbY family RNA-binding protein [Chitinimonas koreensis]